MHAIVSPADLAVADPAPFDGRPPSPARTRADAMARFDDDAGFFERIVPLFRQAALEQSSALVDAVGRGDAAQVLHWAHTLKGALLTVGADAVAQRAEDIEQAASEGRLDGMPAAARRLAAEARIIVEQLAPGGVPAH